MSYNTDVYCLSSILAAVVVGSVLKAVRSWHRHAIAASEAQKLAAAQAAALDDVAEVVEVAEEAADASLTAEMEVVVSNHQMAISAHVIEDIAAPRRTDFVDFRSFMDLMAVQTAFCSDIAFLSNIGPKFTMLLADLLELNGANVWPAGGDELLWAAFYATTAFDAVAKRNPFLVDLNLVQQAKCLRRCRRCMLRQKALLEACSAVEIVEIEGDDNVEEVVRTMSSAIVEFPSDVHALDLADPVCPGFELTPTNQLAVARTSMAAIQAYRLAIVNFFSSMSIPRPLGPAGGENEESSEDSDTEPEIEDELVEEFIFVPPAPVRTVGPVAALDRSVSDASSVGTPGGATPLSAHGTVLGPFNTIMETKRNSPLGQTRISKLNPAAQPFLPTNLNAAAKTFAPSKLNTAAQPFLPSKLNTAAQPFLPSKLNATAKPFVPAELNAEARHFISMEYIAEFGGIVKLTAGESFLLDYAQSLSSENPKNIKN